MISGEIICNKRWNSDTYNSRTNHSFPLESVFTSSQQDSTTHLTIDTLGIIKRWRVCGTAATCFCIQIHLTGKKICTKNTYTANNLNAFHSQFYIPHPLLTVFVTTVNEGHSLALEPESSTVAGNVRNTHMKKLPSTAERLSKSIEVTANTFTIS